MTAPKISARRFGKNLHYNPRPHRAFIGVEMDVAVLRGRIVATLDADADARRRAELDLKTVSPSVQNCQGHVLTIPFKAEEHPGFTDALLDILQAEQEAAVRLSSTHNPTFLPRYTREY